MGRASLPETLRVKHVHRGEQECGVVLCAKAAAISILWRISSTFPSLPAHSFVLMTRDASRHRETIPRNSPLRSISKHARDDQEEDVEEEEDGVNDIDWWREEYS